MNQKPFSLIDASRPPFLKVKKEFPSLLTMITREMAVKIKKATALRKIDRKEAVELFLKAMGK